MTGLPARATRPATDLAGRRVTVMGLGLFGGGVGAARWLAAQGARVTATDLRDAETLAPTLRALEGTGVRITLDGHRAEDFEGADLVVANPAVAPSSRWLRRARRAGAEITSEVALFLERCSARIAAVTGTNGKSSTVNALAQLLEGHAPRVHLGGNIGGSLLEALDLIAPEDVVVLELSSYQLEALPDVAPRVAEVVALTNVGADHLERHGDAARYAAAKARILELLAPDGLALLPAALARHPRFRAPADARTLVHGADEGCDLALVSGRFRVQGEDLGDAASLPLPGEFQRANVLVALGAARRLGAPAAALAARLPALAGLPHRLEDLGLRDGVRVLDNGVSTTPESTLAVLEGLAGTLTVLVGGAAKRGLDPGPLCRALAARDALVVAFGAAGDELAAAAEGAGARAVRVPLEGDGPDVVRAARIGLAATPQGGTLLLSPACASFDAWPNFQARARAFREALPPPTLHSGGGTG